MRTGARWRAWVVGIVVFVGVVEFSAGRDGLAAGNDARVDAVEVLSTPFLHEVDTSGYNATPDATDPAVGCAPEFEYNGNPSRAQTRTAWYRIQPVTAGLLTATTVGSNFDTVLALWATVEGGAPGTMLACNDDQSPFLATSAIPDIFNDATTLAAGQTYLIEVMSHQMTIGGAARLQVTFSGKLAPEIITLSPGGAKANSETDVMVTVSGTGFLPGSVAQMDGDQLATTVNSATELTAMVPVAKLAQAGQRTITVRAPTGSVSSGAGFVVYAAPVIAEVAPGVVTRGVGPMALTVSGSGFSDNLTTATFGGHSRTLDVTSPEGATLQLVAADLQTLGLVHVQLTNGVAGGDPANSASLPVLVRSRADITCDGSVDAGDVLFAARVLAGLDAVASHCSADADGSGGSAPALADLVYLARVVSGLAAVP